MCSVGHKSDTTHYTQNKKNQIKILQSKFYLSTEKKIIKPWSFFISVSILLSFNWREFLSSVIFFMISSFWESSLLQTSISFRWSFLFCLICCSFVFVFQVSMYYYSGHEHTLSTEHTSLSTLHRDARRLPPELCPFKYYHPLAYMLVILPKKFRYIHNTPHMCKCVYQY